MLRTNLIAYRSRLMGRYDAALKAGESDAEMDWIMDRIVRCSAALDRRYGWW